MPLRIEEGGSGEPLLLMPGFTEGVDDVRGVFVTLATRFHVIAVERLGSGRSGPIPREYSHDLYERDARVMAELLDGRGIRAARVVGFSDGGEVGLVLAARRPDLVRALVVWGAVGVVPPTLRPTLDILAEIVDRPPDGLEEWRDSLVVRYGSAENVRRTMRSWTAAIRTLLDQGGDISLSVAKTIRCRVLVIAGESDRFAPVAEVRALAATLSQSEVHIVPGAGHSVHDDRPDWFNATVLEWLAGPARGRAATSG